jgi:hypothetical protein
MLFFVLPSTAFFTCLLLFLLQSLCHRTQSFDVAPKNLHALGLSSPIGVAQHLNLTCMLLGNYFQVLWESTGVSVPMSVLPPCFHTRPQMQLVAIYNLFTGCDCIVPIHHVAADEVWHAYGLSNTCITLTEFDLQTGGLLQTRPSLLPPYHFHLQSK